MELRHKTFISWKEMRPQLPRVFPFGCVAAKLAVECVLPQPLGNQSVEAEMELQVGIVQDSPVAAVMRQEFDVIFVQAVIVVDPVSKEDTQHGQIVHKNYVVSKI